MNIAIASDTHGRIEGLKRELLKVDFTRLLFAGDFLSDSRRLGFHLGVDVDAVLGNCDSTSSGEWEKTLEIAGRRYFLVHGHQYGVKRSLNTIFYRGQEMQADAVVFGHTHVPCCEEIGGMWMLNPGSASRPRRGKLASYILIHCDSDEFKPELRYFPV